jgi:tetratricopeptide (TPR) repeat protein
MAAFTFVCTQCHATLRSGSPIPPGQMVRCPQCGNHFNAGDEVQITALPPRVASPALKTGLLAFSILGVLVALVAATIALVSLSGGEAARESAEDARRRADDDRAALQKRLDDLKDEEARNRRHLEEKIQDLEKQAKVRDERPAAPAPAAPAPAATDPRVAEAKAAEEALKKTHADYEARMDAGRGAMVDQRYADALREFTAALRLLPGDAAASRGKRDAEDRLAGAQDHANQRTAFAALLDKARTALRAKHYDEALAAANDALRIVPGDAEAKQIQSDASRARRTARAEYAQLLAQADALQAAGRYEEASSLYASAMQLFPDDDAAQRGKRLVDQAAQSTQAALSAYFRFMAVGTLAMQNGLFGDAARAFSGALGVLPGDLGAARGLRDARVALSGIVVGQATLYQQLQSGYAALQAQRPADAITAFQAALRIAPDSPLAIAGLRQAKAMSK